MGWSAAVMSLRGEDVIVTHSSPAARDGRISAAIAIGAIMRSNPSLRAELVGSATALVSTYKEGEPWRFQTSPDWVSTRLPNFAECKAR
jgi:hypothetical protein